MWNTPGAVHVTTSFAPSGAYAEEVAPVHYIDDTSRLHVNQSTGEPEKRRRRAPFPRESGEFEKPSSGLEIHHREPCSPQTTSNKSGCHRLAVLYSELYKEVVDKLDIQFRSGTSGVFDTLPLEFNSDVTAANPIRRSFAEKSRSGFGLRGGVMSSRDKQNTEQTVQFLVYETIQEAWEKHGDILFSTEANPTSMTKRLEKDSMICRVTEVKEAYASSKTMCSILLSNPDPFGASRASSTQTKIAHQAPISSSELAIRYDNETIFLLIARGLLQYLKKVFEERAGRDNVKFHSMIDRFLNARERFTHATLLHKLTGAPNSGYSFQGKDYPIEALNLSHIALEVLRDMVALGRRNQEVMAPSSLQKQISPPLEQQHHSILDLSDSEDFGLAINLQDYKGNSPLHYTLDSSQSATPDFLEELLSHPTIRLEIVNGKKETCLFEAVRGDYIDYVRQMLNMRRDLVSKRNSMQQTLLFEAILNLGEAIWLETKNAGLKPSATQQDAAMDVTTTLGHLWSHNCERCLSMVYLLVDYGGWSLDEAPNVHGQTALELFRSLLDHNFLVGLERDCQSDLDLKRLITEARDKKGDIFRAVPFSAEQDHETLNFTVGYRNGIEEISVFEGGLQIEEASAAFADRLCQSATSKVYRKRIQTEDATHACGDKKQRCADDAVAIQEGLGNLRNEQDKIECPMPAVTQQMQTTMSPERMPEVLRVSDQDQDNPEAKHDSCFLQPLSNDTRRFDKAQRPKLIVGQQDAQRPLLCVRRRQAEVFSHAEEGSRASYADGGCDETEGIPFPMRDGGSPWKKARIDVGTFISTACSVSSVHRAGQLRCC